MRKLIYPLLLVLLSLVFVAPGHVLAKTTPSTSPLPSASASATVVATATPTTVPDITRKSEETLGPLETLMMSQQLTSVWPYNPIKYAIRGAVGSGVPVNTIVLLLLLPIMTFVIAFTRNVVGIRGFGIFLPAALSVVFVATGPIVGIGLFLIIVVVSTIFRLILRTLKIKLQYLPRMALILWGVVLGVLGALFLAPYLKFSALSNVSIFAVLILILLSEDFTRVQLGKSAKTAVSLTFQTLVLSLISFFFLTLKPLQEYVLLNPEISLIGVAILDLALGKYTGLRVMEFYRFRKLIQS
ncbi:MAG TPA: 7TM domain-containing protein [Patescibacteria group bacterium]|nr:7TM domain-containing protein [Patescibacteria group bacterium]